MVSLEPHRAEPGQGVPHQRRRRGDRRGASAPTVRVERGGIAEPSHRNPVWLLGGVLLVLASAIGGMVLFQAADVRSEVLVAGHDLAVGDVVDRDDFRIRRIAADGLEVVGPDDVEQLVGRRAVGPVPSGALVHPAMFSDAEPLGPDQMDIGAALDPGAFPRSDLPLGASVELLVVAVPAGGTGATPAAVDAPPTSMPVVEAMTAVGRGTVVAVEERATGQLLVTARVDRAVGLAAAQAAAENRLRLAVVAPEGAEG